MSSVARKRVGKGSQRIRIVGLGNVIKVAVVYI